MFDCAGAALMEAGETLCMLTSRDLTVGAALMEAGETPCLLTSRDVHVLAAQVRR